MILSLAPILTREALDEALKRLVRRSQRLGSSVGSWPRDLKIDLSMVESAEFGVLAQLLLMAERACRENVRLQVDLPISTVAGELADDDDGAVQRRAHCLEWLRKTGFISAVRMTHLGRSEVEIFGLPDDQRFDGDHSSAATAEVRKTDRYLPFRWIRPATGEKLHQSEALTAILNGLREMGLSQRDGRLIVDAIVYELVENVAFYGAETDGGPCPYALVGARLEVSDTTSDPTGYSNYNADVSTERSGSISIRLLIGDAGKGLVARLSSHLPVTVASDQEDRAWAKVGTIAERTILWAFERWSTSNPNSMSEKLGTRGLWRVLRVVQTNGGAVLVRSGDALGGFIKGPGDGVTVVSKSGLAPIVGSLFDVTVLPKPSRLDSPGTAPPIAVPRITLQWVPIRPEDPNALEIMNRTAMEHDVIVTIDGWGRGISHERLVELLGTAAKLTSSSVVAVIVAGVNPMHLHDAVDAIHHAPVSNNSSLDDQSSYPFLLLDETGRPIWCNGSSDARRLLNELLVHGTLRTSDHPDDAVLLQLLDEARLIMRDGDTVSLALRPAEVINHLQHMAENALRAAIDQEHPSILRGAFRTPTLRLTDRWIDVEEVVQRTSGIATAAFLLMQKLAAEMPQGLHEGVNMVQVGPVTLPLSQAFMESAGLHGIVYVMADEFDSPAGVDRIRSGTEVILCCDILLTDNSVRRAITEILSWGAVPRAIVVPIDARPDDGPIDVLGVSVPVARLVRAEIPEPQVSPDQIVDIDPVLRTPVPPRYLDQQRGLLWETNSFLAGCTEQARIIGLGHIERPAHGHFTVYLDAGKVIESQNSFSAEAAQRMASAALEWLNEASLVRNVLESHPDAPVNRQIVVCYPGHPDDYAGRLARLIVNRIAPHIELTGTASTLAVPRSVAGSRWAFPDALDKLPSGCEVILTDWGCINASTIMQLIRLASEAGASRILGLIMISQLDAHEERALTMIRSVSCPPRENASLESNSLQNPQERYSADESTIPTRLRFLTALGISAVPRGNCPLCRLTSQLVGDADNRMLPSPIAEHARQLSNQLNPVTREEAVNREADAFGAPVRTDEAVEYIRLRGDLVAALRSTSRSQMVADHMEKLARQPKGVASHAAIRLLAAERQWLKLPPLRFSACRNNVAEVGYEVASDRDANKLLRLEAVVVLASVAPDLLVARLPRLWTASINSHNLLLHIVYYLHRIVHRTPGEIPVSLEELRTQISACREVSGLSYASENGAEEMEWLLTNILFAVDRAAVEQLNLEPHEAWSRLRQHYIFKLERHADAEGALIRMLLLMEEPIGEGSSPDWELMLRSWKTVETFLQQHVLPFLRPLSGVLLGAFAEEHFLQRERAWLEADGAVRKLTELASGLYDLRIAGRTANEFASAWNSFAIQLDELRRTVLLSGEEGREPATLASFISACPTLLLQTLRECVDEARYMPVDISANLNDDFEVKVFCHEELVRNTIMQLIDNVVTHRDPEYGDLSLSLDIGIVTDRDQVELIFRNTGTRASGKPGNGIVDFQRRLRDFGASLQVVTPSEDWTFEVHLRLPYWSASG